jgi:hypothetical protein
MVPGADGIRRGVLPYLPINKDGLRDPKWDTFGNIERTYAKVTYSVVPRCVTLEEKPGDLGISERAGP